MKNSSGVVKMDDHTHMELPPGFRFHPTDEELITHYLLKKVLDCNFSAIAIDEVDMNKVEPWELPWKAKLGENEWYFFSVRDKKYPTGLRTNRATPAGYWKATGKDKEIFQGKTLVGMKKTLVFYQGRAPNGEKSNWVNHEYRLEGKISLQNLPKSAENEWVINRVFHKTSGGKKVHISGLMRMPPLMDPSPKESGPTDVPCFSSSIVDHQKIQGNMGDCFNNPVLTFPSNSVNIFPGDSFTRGQFSGDPSIFRSLLGNHGRKTRLGFRNENGIVSISHETNNYCVVSNLEMGKKTSEVHEEAPPPTSVGPEDLDCIWNY